MPGLGLGILTRNINLIKLTCIFSFSNLASAGLDKVGISYLQKYFDWSKSNNYKGSMINQISTLAWVGIFLKPLTATIGEVGLLACGQIAAMALYSAMFFVDTVWEVFVVRAALYGALALSFPATAALKGSLVSDAEQGHVQGALTTMKGVAAACGPSLFGAVFNAAGEKDDMTWAASIWIVGAAINAALLPLIASVPRDIMTDKNEDGKAPSGRRTMALSQARGSVLVGEGPA